MNLRISNSIHVDGGLAIAMKNFLTVLGVVLVTIGMICLGAVALAQDSDSPNTLGDVARQTRAQVAAATENKGSKAQGLLDEMQREQERSDNAPTGFTNYDAGDYNLFVPFPFSLEGRENGGAVLLGSSLGVTNTEVMAGTPIPMPANLSDSDLFNLVRQLATQHGPASCFSTKLGARKAFRCGLNKSSLLGRDVWGTAEYVVTSNSLIPVMCVSADNVGNCVTQTALGNRACGNRYPSWQQIQNAKASVQTQQRDQRTTAQVCDQIIYPSIQLKEDIVVHPATLSETTPSKPPVAAAMMPTQDRDAESQAPSLAELARQTRQTPHGTAKTTFDNAEGKSVAPAGFQSFVLTYCQNPQQCLEATVVIPEKAEIVSQINGQHIFKATLNGEPVMLYAGPADVNAPYRSLTDPDYIRMRDLANSNGWSREKPDRVSTQDMTIEGRTALMTRFRYQRDQKRWWIGERVLIEGRVLSGDKNAQFLLGCAAPEEHFADAEALCATLVNSLRLP